MNKNVFNEDQEDYNDAVKAIQESDGETISREEMLKRYGVSVEDLQDYEAGMKAREQFKQNPVTHSIDDVIQELEQEL